jgi:hypothetical protein
MPALIRKSRSTGKREAIAVNKVQACARILVVLRSGPMTSTEVSDAINVPHSTAGTYLRHMRDKLRQIHVVTDRSKARARMWALGAPRGIVTSDGTHVKFEEVCRSSVPARQIGMWRHPLDIAFFGPAGEQRT